MNYRILTPRAMPVGEKKHNLLRGGQKTGEMKRLLFFLLLCLSPAARAHAPASSKATTGTRSSPVDLSRPPRVITPEIISHLREAAKAKAHGEKTAAVSGLGQAHSELLSRVAALSSSASAGKQPNVREKRVGEDGGREIMRSVLEAAAAKEGRGGGGGAEQPAAEKLAALAAGRGAASAASASARSKRPTVMAKTLLPPANSRPLSLSPPSTPPSSPLWLPKPAGAVWKRLAAKKTKMTTRSRVAAPRKEEVDEL